MYHFLQFKPNKKEEWRLYDESQLAGLPKPPAFITVLAVDKDPESVAEQGEDPIEHVKYFGPMYFDFDGPDLDEVLDEVREVLIWLHKKLDIPKEFIHCWLSGQKGVHLTIPSQVFGVKTPIKALPWAYREIAAIHQGQFLDMGVYSCGRGRMWRCEGVARPVTGTFKVGVSFAELEGMDAEQYGVLVANPRPSLERQVPAKSLVFPKAEATCKVARSAAAKRRRALKGSVTVPRETLRAYEGIPGCIEKLITDGDNAESNWNQAAMQVAAYVAARYEKTESEEYEQDIVGPFVANVHSSSRPTETERHKHVHEQLNRAFSGRMKFSTGALISVIGKPCGNCPICRADVAAGEITTEGEITLDPDTRVKATTTGYHYVNETGMRRLTNFLFLPHTRVHVLETDTEGKSRKGDVLALIGTLVDEYGVEIRNREIETDAWSSKGRLVAAIGRIEDVFLPMAEADIQPIYKAVRSLARLNKREVKEMIRTTQCGVIFYDGESGLTPHYVESGGAYARHETDSPFKFQGEHCQSPTLLKNVYPFDDDRELEATLAALTQINEPHLVAQMIGWAVACHFREHVHMACAGQFPLMNISGGAGSGKSSTAMLVCHLNGIDYDAAGFLNVEITTPYPLTLFVSSSTTVPRLLEEVNPQNMKPVMAREVLGILKAAWNKAVISKGAIVNGKLGTTNTRISSPILYVSEQGPTESAIQERTLVVQLSPRTLVSGNVSEQFKAAYLGRASLFRMAKALVTQALITSPKAVGQIVDSMAERVPEQFGIRPRFAFQVALFGLDTLARTMDECGVKGSAAVNALGDSLVAYLSSNVSTLRKDKIRSAVDKVLAYMDVLAGESADRTTGLRAGDHYWRSGDYLYLVLQDCMPRYRRYMVGMQEKIDIREVGQMASLMAGETYYDRLEPHPTREGVDVHVVNIKGLREKGTPLTNFQDETEPSEL
jgi:hypothetical protein